MTSWNHGCNSLLSMIVAPSIFGYGILLAVMLLLVVVAYRHLAKENDIVKVPHRKTVTPSNTSTAATTTTTTTIKNTKVRKGVVCPFSQGTDFTIELAEHLPLSPLEQFEDWVEEYDQIPPLSATQPPLQLEAAALQVGATANSNVPLKPLAARFLNLGISGQDTPGILRAGLRRLRNSKYLLLEEPHRMPFELMLKKKAYDDPKRFPEIFVALEDSLEAQRECLDLFLDYLPRRYPDQYKYSKELNTITVQCIDTTFQIADYYDTRPLELCVRIVQEDLVLMCPPSPDNAAKGASYFMAAAGVVFSSEDIKPSVGYQKHRIYCLRSIP